MASLRDETAAPSAADVLAGGGAMGALMRALDWAATPLGAVESWSPSLCTMVKVLLANRFPLLLWWGPEQCQLYNDAYRPVLGAKHPRSLGQPARECFPEIWHIIGPLIQTPYEGGPSTWDDDLFLEVYRHGFVEETHFTVAYSPVPDDTVPGGIGGVLATVHEITQQVIQERRLAVLRDLGAGAPDAKTAAEACASAAAALAQHPRDVPFALLYLLDADQQTARLAAAAGVPAGTMPGPEVVDLAAVGQRDAAWPLAAVLETEQPQIVENLPGRFESVPPGPWSDPPERALVLPLPSTTPHRPAGLLVLGLSARLEIDDPYRSFGTLVAGQIGAAIVNARAYEEERRRAEALAELDRAKTAFFSNVSHEFRTPLTLLLGPLEEALAAPPETPLRAERAHLESAHRNSLRLLRLVNTLLDFSRIEAGRAEASYEPTDLAALTAGLASAFHTMLLRAGLRLVIDCPPLPQPVYVDREMWEKIVLNLLSNAFKFTLEGEIAVVLRAVGDHVKLTVRDSGVGIPPAELPHLFERFHRVRGARARTHEGTGIGLAFVRELVALHGGTIGVESAPGVGTTFTITLPLGSAHLSAARIGAARTLASTALGAAPYVEEALRWLPDPDTVETAEAVRPAEETALPGAGAPGAAAAAPRILLADDNADMRAYLRRLLGARYAVEAVSDGAAALAAARERPPDLLVTDMMMPGLDGFELLRELRADPRTRMLPVILLSARAGQEATAEGLEAGADDYLVKPFAAGELLARVQAHLALARVRREAMEALRVSEERQAFLLELSDALRPLSDPAEIEGAACRLLGERLGAQRAYYVAIHEAQDFAVVEQDYVRGGLPSLVRVYPLAAFRWVTPLYKLGRPVVVADLRTSPLVPESDLAAMEAAQVIAWIAIPLVKRGELVGALCVADAQPREWDKTEVALVEEVGERIWAAVERARAEAALRASEERYRAIAETANEGIWLIDREARTLFANARLATILGTTVDDLQARTVLDFVFEEDLLLAQERIGQNLAGQPEQFDFRFRRADGTPVEVLAGTSPLRDAVGAIVGALGLFSDITARRRAEAAARQQAALLALAHDAIVVRAPDGRIIAWNDGAAALYGWTAAEAVGQIMHGLLRARVIPTSGADTEIDAALAAHGAWEGELEQTRRDGTQVVVESRQALLRAADGTPEAILEVNRDIAPRLELATALARLQTLQAISDATLTQLALPALLRQVLEQITSALAVDNTAILLLDETEETLIVHTALGPEEAQAGQMRVPLGRGVAGRIAATQQPLIVTDLRTIEPVNPLLREQMASLMGVPLLVEGRLIGVMHVDSTTPRRFTDDELHLLQLVGDRVALALDNARLYHDALEARDQVARLQRVTAALSAAVTTDEMAGVIIAQGLEALGATSGSLALLSDDGASFSIVRAVGYSPETVERWATFPSGAAVPLADAVRARELVILTSRHERDTRYPHLAEVRAAPNDGAMVAIPVGLGERMIGSLGLSFAQPRGFSAEECAVMSALGELCAQALERARLYEAEQQAHAEAEAERARLQQVLDVLPTGIVIANVAGHFTMANQAVVPIFGAGIPGRPVPRGELEAHEIYGVYRLDGTPYPSAELPLQRALWRGEAVRGDRFLTRTPAGREIPVLANSAPLRNPEGRIVGAVGVFQDISAIRDLEQAREEFLSSAAHDLKTPLTGIRGQAQLAQRRLARLAVPAPETQSIAAALAQVDAGTQRMVNLIDELIDVTRLQMGALLELDRRPTDLLALVRAVVAEHDAAAPGRLHVQTDLSALHGAVDAVRLERVVGNLLSNALKYSPAGGAIEVRVTREEEPAGPVAVISVRDEGLGIPAADLPHVFERFYRAGNVAGQVQGTGIGLASARQIVERHGGSIAVQSVEGQGATFTVRLPLVEP